MATGGGVAPPAKARVRKPWGTLVVHLVQLARHGRLPICEATVAGRFQRRRRGKVFTRASSTPFYRA
jgi:hypothetical protein